ncbi:hypothetical protein Tsubulata_049412 [Turnera subulata]|uniref:F-box domain-containing protein n=1 Tax=Turnera subulata TaxID=218843 RepID=A0A9Q0JF43_9ROSI|nr:hypothetical protein Tsubulata_049412 [Turnera subulata]
MMKKPKTIYPGRLMINDLPDVLLTEILARVDSHKCALTCKLVCKQWYSLISCSDFVSRFITLHEDHHSLIVLSMGAREGIHGHLYWCMTFIGSQDLESAWTHSTSKTFGKKSECIYIKSSNNDLLLCEFENGMHNAWYVHNPFTTEWFPLPSPPSRLVMAITCDPSYVRDTQGRLCLQNSGRRRFKVLCIGHVRGWPRKEVAYYCSESNRWSEPVRLVNPFSLPSTNFVAYQGKFYWVAETPVYSHHIIVYDPTGAGSEKRLCDFPAGEKCWGTGSRLARLGVCQGSLRMMRTFWMEELQVLTLCVWEILIEDEEHGKISWRLKHSIPSDQMSSQDSSLQSIPKSKIKLLEFDPVNVGIVYLDLCDCIVSCNLTTRNLQVVSEVPSHLISRYPYIKRDVSNMIFPLAHPCWRVPLFS